MQGLDLLNLPLGGIVTSAPWTSALATSLGPSLLIAIVVMAIAWFAWKSPGIPIARALTTRHGRRRAVAGGQRARRDRLAAMADAAVAVPARRRAAYWIGALAPLAVMAHRRDDVLPRVLKQFSAIAMPLVGLLVLSGLALSIIQLGSVRALIETRYGILLSIKLALVILLLGLAALNRFICTPAVVADHENTRPLLAIDPAGMRSRGLVFWPSSPAGASRRRRACGGRRAAPLSIHIHTDAAMFQVLVSPARSAPTILCCS